MSKKVDRSFINVFVYGTLMQEHIRQEVLRVKCFGEKEILRGYRVGQLDIIKDKNSFVNGQIIRVSKSQLDRLDQYERVGDLYKRIIIDTDNYKDVFVYQKINENIEIAEFDFRGNCTTSLEHKKRQQYSDTIQRLQYKDDRIFDIVEPLHYVGNGQSYSN